MAFGVALKGGFIWKNFDVNQYIVDEKNFVNYVVVDVKIFSDESPLKSNFPENYICRASISEQLFHFLEKF